MFQRANACTSFPGITHLQRAGLPRLGPTEEPDTAELQLAARKKWSRERCRRFEINILAGRYLLPSSVITSFEYDISHSSEVTPQQLVRKQ